MAVTYLTTPIAEARRDYPRPGSGMTREGYTKRSGAPTSIMIRLDGEKKWRRLMVWQFSNLGTLFVNIDGKPHVVREEMLPTIQETSGGSKPSVHHAEKKRPAQLDREIAEALAPGRNNGRRDGSPRASHATKTPRSKWPPVTGSHELGTADARTREGAYWIVTRPKGYRVEYKPWGPSEEIDLGTFASRRQARAKIVAHAGGAHNIVS